MENTMNEQTKLILALMQIENVSKLLKDGQYTGFFTSHLLPIKFEIERQLNCLTNNCHSSTINE
jgi:hypothetical protein